jgi:hypothetical protein
MSLEIVSPVCHVSNNNARRLPESIRAVTQPLSEYQIASIDNALSTSNLGVIVNILTHTYGGCMISGSTVSTWLNQSLETFISSTDPNVYKLGPDTSDIDIYVMANPEDLVNVLDQLHLSTSAFGLEWKIQNNGKEIKLACNYNGYRCIEIVSKQELCANASLIINNYTHADYFYHSDAGYVLSEDTATQILATNRFTNEAAGIWIDQVGYSYYTLPSSDVNTREHIDYAPFSLDKLRAIKYSDPELYIQLLTTKVFYELETEFYRNLVAMTEKGVACNIHSNIQCDPITTIINALDGMNIPENRLSEIIVQLEATRQSIEPIKLAYLLRSISSAPHIVSAFASVNPRVSAILIPESIRDLVVQPALGLRYNYIQETQNGYVNCQRLTNSNELWKLILNAQANETSFDYDTFLALALSFSGATSQQVSEHYIIDESTINTPRRKNTLQRSSNTAQDINDLTVGTDKVVFLTHRFRQCIDYYLQGYTATISDSEQSSWLTGILNLPYNTRQQLINELMEIKNDYNISQNLINEFFGQTHN